MTPLRRSGQLQHWLQRKPWPLWRIGNAISDARFWIWGIVSTKDDA